MKENNNSQHQNQEPQSKKAKTSLIVITICAILIIVVICVLFALRNPNAPSDADTDPNEQGITDESNAGDATEDTQNGEEIKYITIETTHCPLLFPAEYSENLDHMEVNEGEVSTEVFSMVHNGTKTELFRIYFSDTETGELVGYLHTDVGATSVTYTVSEYENFADEETKELYFGMMSGLGFVIDSICSDSRFSENRFMVPDEKSDAAMTYWTVSLPKNMEWEETTEDGIYRADFYGTIDDKKIMLYTVSLGETESDDLLGTFLIDGTAMPISVEVHDLGNNANLSDDELSAIYRMMETVNDVVQIITSSENYLAN